MLSSTCLSSSSTCTVSSSSMSSTTPLRSSLTVTPPSFLTIFLFFLPCFLTNQPLLNILLAHLCSNLAALLFLHPSTFLSSSALVLLSIASSALCFAILFTLTFLVRSSFTTPFHLLSSFLVFSLMDHPLQMREISLWALNLLFTVLLPILPLQTAWIHTAAWGGIIVPSLHALRLFMLSICTLVNGFPSGLRPDECLFSVLGLAAVTILDDSILFLIASLSLTMSRYFLASTTAVLTSDLLPSPKRLVITVSSLRSLFLFAVEIALVTSSSMSSFSLSFR
mmetsp:Transcript_17657/g.36662  ORF Transcript_17657/g.36662 Transcript_17657/m.36662 type:complete len:281 (-) Transcript_17657:334-1176(-)